MIDTAEERRVKDECKGQIRARREVRTSGGRGDGEREWFSRAGSEMDRQRAGAHSKRDDVALVAAECAPRWTIETSMTEKLLRE